ncbi:hypothetical protein CDAR_215801 [Caerostris darwini]|uniref:Uncharacterized protein n=1 Tax=Caerostris darwini TaxID=1538125 RepID=A0AAV4M7R7_9ARAC|nr:hypothetical protein CDAR_215801 [Caerostris darwini]
MSAERKPISPEVWSNHDDGRLTCVRDFIRLVVLWSFLFFSAAFVLFLCSSCSRAGKCRQLCIPLSCHFPAVFVSTPWINGVELNRLFCMAGQSAAL